ncbi:unnamed protein product, partial [Laminaria digitata]
MKWGSVICRCVEGRKDRTFHTIGRYTSTTVYSSQNIQNVPVFGFQVTRCTCFWPLIPCFYARKLPEKSIPPSNLFNSITYGTTNMSLSLLYSSTIKYLSQKGEEKRESKQRVRQGSCRVAVPNLTTLSFTSVSCVNFLLGRRTQREGKQQGKIRQNL